LPVDGGPADAVDPEQEIEGLVEQLQENPSDNRLIKQLADAYLKIPNIDKVILGWAGLVERHPDAWKLQTQLAKALRRRATMHKVFSRRVGGENNKRDFGESEIDIWLRLVNKHPKEWSLQVQLKKAFAKKGDIDEEIRGWHTLVSKNPKDWKLQSDLAQAYAKKDDKVMTDKTLGTMDQEIVGWRNLVKQWPDEWGLSVRLAEAYTKKTRMEEAIRNWISAMQRSREKKAYSLLATAVKRRQDTNREIKDWAALVDAHPGSRGLQMQLEMAYAKRQDPAIAIEGWKELVANHPEQQELSIHLQRAYERREPTPQNLNGEIEGWKQLIRKWPRVLTLQGHLAEVFLRFDDDSGQEIAHWIDLLNEFPQEQEFRDRVLHACLLCDNLAEAWGHLGSLDRTCPQNEEIPEVLREMFAN
jgi:tetratricopeptide (TPR) repeat protein